MELKCPKCGKMLIETQGENNSNWYTCYDCNIDFPENWKQVIFGIEKQKVALSELRARVDGITEEQISDVIDKKSEISCEGCSDQTCDGYGAYLCCENRKYVAKAIKSLLKGVKGV